MKDEKPPLWKIWWTAARPHTLTASIAPVLVGHVYTVVTKRQENNNNNNDNWVSVLWLFFCVCVQLGTNLHNDYADFVKGADTTERVGHARATQKGWLSPWQTATAATVTLTAALVLGISLLYQTTTTTTLSHKAALWFLILSSVFNAVAYTGGPYPLGYIGLSHVSIAYWGLADIFVFVYFGLVATLMIPHLVLRNHDDDDYYVVAPTPAIVLACPVGWLATGILVVNNLRDRHTDRLAHKRTIAVRFGPTFCRTLYWSLVALSYAVLPVLVVVGNNNNHYNYWMLLPLLSIPTMAIPCLKAVCIDCIEGPALNHHVGGTARLQMVYCILLSIGLTLGQ